MAVDLRESVGELRISNDLERIGDLEKNIQIMLDVGHWQNWPSIKSIWLSSAH